MSLQDKIFDVEAALEGKPQAELFDELVSYIGQLERENMLLTGQVNRLKMAADAIKELFRDE